MATERQIICPCCEYKWTPGKQRSVPQHRRFWGIISKAFENWPEKHRVQFERVDAFRKWLIARCGFYDVLTMSPDGVHVLVTPKSIAFENMGPREFGELCDTFTKVIEQETGIEAKQLERAAA